MVALVLTAAIGITWQVFTRYFLGFSNQSLEFIVVYLVVWSTFIGLATAERRDLHVRFTVVEAILPPAGRRALRLLARLVALAVVLALAWMGFELILESRLFGEQLPTALRLPLWIPKMAIAIGAALLALQYLVSIHRIWSEDEAHDEAAGPAHGSG